MQFFPYQSFSSKEDYLLGPSGHEQHRFQARHAPDTAAAEQFVPSSFQLLESCKQNTEQNWLGPFSPPIWNHSILLALELFNFFKSTLKILRKYKLTSHEPNDQCCCEVLHEQFCLYFCNLISLVLVIPFKIAKLTPVPRVFIAFWNNEQ